MDDKIVSMQAINELKKDRYKVWTGMHPRVRPIRSDDESEIDDMANKETDELWAILHSIEEVLSNWEGTKYKGDQNVKYVVLEKGRGPDRVPRRRKSNGNIEGILPTRKERKRIRKPQPRGWSLPGEVTSKEHTRGEREEKYLQQMQGKASHADEWENVPGTFMVTRK